ncbi:hypothetical protein SI65_00266 [Aspergillus cristatus]|uniref:Endosomal peripheral membrane protein n=1 Tax=Aspergillus cristatus TaxID=573508 RepID=A0A1E3BP61_ASPCR|nr:hypothetical protein SI65_00266 [Aspergillus cristatus]
MSSQFLQAELLHLIQESKRKNADLRNAAETSLNELKALPSTSEAQTTADLVRRPKFVDPFIITCHSRHAKLAGIGVVCLQRLVASRSLPPERLRDVLNGLRETTNLSLDIQLKILQTLPSLLQHYSNELSGELLVSTLEICAMLQASKTLAVSSTAAATLQQLVTSTFERIAIDDKILDSSKPTETVTVDDHPVTISHFAYDALRVLDDLCRLVDGEPLQFLRMKSLSPTFTLELIESILVNNGNLFVGHAELTQVLRARLMPLTVRYLSERHNFAQTVRVSRILLICLKRHMSLLTAECEMALGLLTHLLEPDGTAPWKRVICMELFRSLYAEPGLVRLMYSLYDGEEGRKNVLRDHMASLVRVASERPSLIGVGSQSTVPTRAEHSRSITEEQITLEAGGVAGVIGTSVPTDTNVPGVSSQWSVVRSPYMEILDKTDAPLPPDTYIYSLILNCITVFAEGLAKFILPLTVPEFKHKRKNRIATPDQEPSSPVASSSDLQRTHSWKITQNSKSKKSPVPVNPLELESHPQISAIKMCAGIIENCWPAVLATCSTFLYAALDDEFYHSLVRSFQKLAHVAGLLRLSVPRDAFLTTLGKAAMPPETGGAKTGTSTAPVSDSQNDYASEKRRKGAEIGSPLPADSPSATSDSHSVLLSTRNLLCLRALLNLGIALGPILDQPAWSIILETLQDTDLLIGISSVSTMKSSAAVNSPGDAATSSGIDVPKANLGAEIIAVQTASNKMFESTNGYPTDSFQDILVALLSLSRFTEEASQEDPSGKVSGAPRSPQSLRRSGHMRKNTRRVSLTVGKSKAQDEQLKFVLEKADEIAKANLERLSSLDENDLRSWQSLTDSLISGASHGDVSQALRLKASEVLNNLVFQTMKQNDVDDDSLRNTRQLRNLETLKKQINSLYNSKLPGSYPAVVIEIHEQSLEILKNILEQYAETFADGWTLVFDLISSVFGEVMAEERSETSTANSGKASLLADSPRLIRAAYKSLQLVASDFLSLLPAPCRLDLVDSLSGFASQQQDFNISLTTTSSFWNVSDFLQGQIERFTIESHVDASVGEEDLAALAKDNDVSVSRNSLWLLLLLRIVDLATDSRTEIRNCAVHTLLRIFDAYGQQLSAKAWRLCLNRVLFQMVENVEAELTRVVRERSGANPHELKPWIDTTVVMIKGSAELITTFFDSIVQDEEFDHSWERLLNYFQTLIGLGLLEFSEAVFSSLSNILLRVESPTGFSKQALESTWSLWDSGHPASKEDLLDLDCPNQDSALAYLQSFEQVYRLHKDNLTRERIAGILGHMKLLAWNSVSPRYSPDIDRSSTLQSLIIASTKTICLDKKDSQPEILLCLADYVDSALSKWTPGSDSRRPTFVAFSKSAVDLLRWYIADFGIKKDVFTDGSLATALKHLSNPIAQKYEWQGKDREPRLWQKATTTSLDILQVAIPYVEKQYEKSIEGEISRFWECVVDIVRGIVSAKGYRTKELSMADMLADESFDITAFNRLKSLIIPSLGAAVIKDNIRRDFASALFHSSFIYAPKRFDLPDITTLTNNPLKGIYDVRPGRTFELPPTTRSKMAYVLIDAMFELAAVPGDDGGHQEPHTLLARSISPYLILRSAVSLRAYIADQPLRGLMPQPTPARKVLLHLLRGMVELRSEPSAIPEPPVVRSVAASLVQPNDGHQLKKHLEWIYPLVVKALQVAGKEKDDGEVLRVLGEVLQEVGHCGI